MRRLTWCGVTVLLLQACCGAGAGSVPPPASRRIVSIQVSGSPVMVFDHARDQQEPMNLPDAQVTAWREAGGMVSLLIPSTENYRMRGPDLLHLSMDPSKIYSSTASGEHVPEDQHDYDHWLSGPHSNDGVSFVTLAHSEWYACLLNGDCAQATTNGIDAGANSWANAVTSFASSDGGATWKLNTVNGNHTVADTAYHWSGTAALAQHVYLQATNLTGMFGPSRLVPEGGWWYAVANYVHRDFTRLDTAHGIYEAPIDGYGYVLIRTSDPTDPNGWKAWDGGGAFNPISSQTFLPFLPTSNGVQLDAASPQLIHDSVTGSCILIFTVNGGSNPIYYMTTGSLARPAWSEAAPIVDTATLTSDPGGPVKGFNNENYPSIIDPDAPGYNFDSTAGSPMLFYSTSPASYGGDNLARDVFRVPLVVGYSP